MPNTAIANVPRWAGKTITGPLAEEKSILLSSCLAIDHYEKIKLSRKRNTGSSNPVLGISPSRFKIEGPKSPEHRITLSIKNKRWGGRMNCSFLLWGVMPFGLELGRCDIIGYGTNLVRFLLSAHMVQTALSVQGEFGAGLRFVAGLA